MKISVFGGSSPKSGEPAYLQAYQLGSRLAEQGHIVMTGGYIGTMEASSKGAKEAGGEVWGFTCDEIEYWRPVKPNHYIDKEIRFHSLNDRIFALIAECDAAIALPGGVGTLAEISLLWTHVQIASFNPKPIILLGEAWENVFTNFITQLPGYTSQASFSQITFAKNLDEVLEILSA